MKKFWSIPIVLAFLYGITILTQYGYDSFFSLPASFVGASIASNTLFAYSAVEAFLQILTALHWWWWPIIIVTITVTGVLSYLFLESGSSAFWGIISVTALLFLYFAPTLGNIIAKEKIDFLVTAPGCSIGPDQAYLVPDIYDGKAIIVSFDPKTKKLDSEFSLKDLSQFPCKLEYENIGPIRK
jgi:hypothetical protein